MKFLSDEIVDLYKMYFENMKVKDFNMLEAIPDGVSQSEMQNLANFIKMTKQSNTDIDISEMKIGDLVYNYFIVNNTNLE
jgi:hypothetical protein